MLAQLGNIQFEGLNGFTSLQEGKEASYVEHERILNKPKVQRTGSKLNTVPLTIRLNHSFTNPEERMEELDQARNEGTVMPLILGTGRFLGNYVIRRTHVGIRRTDASGSIWEAVLDIDLLEIFDVDIEHQEKTQAIIDAIALDYNKPVISGGTLDYEGTTEPSIQIVGAKAKARRIDRLVSGARDISSKAQHLSGRVEKASQELQQTLYELHTTVEKIKSEIINAQEILNDVTDAIESAGELEVAAGLQNITTMLEANGNLQQGFNRLNSSSIFMVGQTASREG